MAVEHTNFDELDPELQELARRLNTTLTSAPPRQLYLFWRRLRDMQVETASAPNHVKYLFGQLMNLFYERLKKAANAESTES